LFVVAALRPTEGHAVTASLYFPVQKEDGQVSFVANAAPFNEYSSKELKELGNTHFYYRVTDNRAAGATTGAPEAPAPIGSFSEFIDKRKAKGDARAKILEYAYGGTARDSFNVDDLIAAGKFTVAQREAARRALARTADTGYLKVVQKGRGGGSGEARGKLARYGSYTDSELSRISTAVRIQNYLDKYGSTVDGKVLGYLQENPGSSFTEKEALTGAGLEDREKFTPAVYELVNDGLIVQTEKGTPGSAKAPRRFGRFMIAS
jgi:hypothetical protein